MLPVPDRPSTDISLFIPDATGVTTSWITSLLQTPATIVDVSPVGTGQMSSTFRAKFTLDGGDEEVESLIVKVASDSEESRALGIGGAYLFECSFYEQLGPIVAKTTAVPYCWLSVYEPGGFFTLVLEDMDGSVQGNQLVGCSPAEAKLALSALAKFQAPFLADPEVPTKYDCLSKLIEVVDQAKMYRSCLPVFLEQYKGRVSSEHAEFCQWVATIADRWVTEHPADTVYGLCHRDYRLDNILFPTKGDRVVAVDFQGICWGSACEDLSYFIGSSVLPDERAQCEKELIRGYLKELNGAGEPKLNWDQAWYQYRRASIFGILQAVWASVLCKRTERGDLMFLTLLARHARQCIEINVKELFP